MNPKTNHRWSRLPMPTEKHCAEPASLALFGVPPLAANKEIAVILGIGEDTVKQHVSRILQKLRVSDRAQATAEAIRRGLVKI